MAWVGTYILDEHGNPVPCSTLEWGVWFENAANRRVAFTDLGVLGHVSTVFLGLDHNFNPMEDPLSYRPVLWETMVLGGVQDGLWRRYRSRAEAEQGHQEMVRKCIEEAPDEGCVGERAEGGGSGPDPAGAPDDVR